METKKNKNKTHRQNKNLMLTKSSCSCMKVFTALFHHMITWSLTLLCIFQNLVCLIQDNLFEKKKSVGGVLCVKY